MTDTAIHANFLCPRLSAREYELEALGIRVLEPDGRASPRNGQIEIGAVIVVQSDIYALPKIGLSQRHHELLLGAAEAAFHQPPRKADGWRFTRRGGVARWVTWITAAECGSVTAGASAASRQGHPEKRDAA